MSVTYRAVQWNRHKLVYDAVSAVCIVGFILVFIAFAFVFPPGNEPPDSAVLLIRATGFAAISMLHVVLLIGPLARVWPKAKPLLYNRRHLGVMTFLVALLHALAVIGYYHAFGEMNPVVSLLVNTARAEALPFEYFGILALLIMFLMAATSHDYWLRNLSAAWWKRLHMLVYVAYFALVAHVGFGYMQGETGWTSAALMGAGLVLVVGSHLLTGLKETRRDGSSGSATDGWLDAGPLAEIPEGRANIVCPKDGERIAVYKHEGKVFAIENVCAHQGGPLGEGNVIDGCITCPWHGFQFRPEDGQSPPPFNDLVPTYEVRIDGERVLVKAEPRTGGAT